MTGLRLVYPSEAVPVGVGGAPFDPASWARLDGASPSGQILTAFEAVPDLSGAAFHDTIDRSLGEDSPTILLDLETGERLPHWVELDARAEPGEPTVVFVRLVDRLEEDRSYGVAFRGLVDGDGAPVPPSPAFLALREGRPTDDPELERRRPDAEALFAALDGVGWARDSLTVAWRFHTASGDAIRGDLLHIRADALERLGPGGIGCAVLEVIDGYGEGTDLVSHRWIRGTITVPSYLDRPDPPARFVRGADGRPTYVEDVEVEFSAVIPAGIGADPRPERFAIYGHGLMGDHEDYTTGALRWQAERQQMVLAATN